MKQLHMICNAHLDPVWLWEWEEGAAEALSTFRVAAEFCEKYDGFVFNHNEALLYQWVEEYEPALFERIRRLVEQGRWHIMGGWYLQPDCVMPSGESITRQILRGRQYFMEKFGKAPQTAINFDSFGHSRGLVQILRKAGYTSYLVTRPGDVKRELAQKDLMWKGFDGSEIMVHHCADTGYSTAYGEMAEKLENWLKANEDQESGLFLWGIGDHGGGPSRKDLNDLNTLMARHPEINMMHSTPESYFAVLDKQTLPVWSRPLTHELTGCYVSQYRTKHMHRRLEDRLYYTEKLLSMAAAQGLMVYPQDELRKAERALLDAEFHDVLPGSAIPSVEVAAQEKMGFGMELLSRLRAKGAFALSQGLQQVKDGEGAILVYNPHPYEVHTIVECEMVLPRQNFEKGFMVPCLSCNGEPVRTQTGLPETCFFIDWRKRVVIDAVLPPCSVTRYDCRFQLAAEKPKPVQPLMGQDICFSNGDIEVVIDGQTGCVDRYSRGGQMYLCPGSFAIDVYKDWHDTWNFGDPYSKEKEGSFELMTPEECAEFCAVPCQTLPPIHVVEDGDVRMVVEVALKYRSSKMLMRYLLPKRGGEMGVEIRLFWQEKEKIAKMSLKTALNGARHCGQSMWGMQMLDETGREDVSQRWCGLRDEERFLTVINRGTYASSVGEDGELRIVLLRSACYATSDSADGLQSNRPDYSYTERMDQGKHDFSFFIQGGETQQRVKLIDREAQFHAETPFALSINPSGEGKKNENSWLAVEGNDAIVMEAMKMAEDGNGFILRMRNSLDTPQNCVLRLGDKLHEIAFSPYEVQTYRFCPETGTMTQENLLA